MNVSDFVTMSAPSMGGYLTYHPSIALSETTQSQLAEVLENVGVTAECENPAICLDWRLAGPDKVTTEAAGHIWQGYTHRGAIVLYCDGGDAFDPGIVFYRKEEIRDHSIREWVHVPPRATQAWLTEAALEWQRDLTGEKLKVLNAYVARLANDSAAWTSLAEVLLPKPNVPEADRIVDHQE